MTELQIKTKTVHTVDSGDLEEFICQHYDLGHFDATLESPNDSTHEFNVKKAPLDEYEQEQFDEAIASNGIEHYFLGVVLTDLANKDLIPEGDYLIGVCW